MPPSVLEFPAESDVDALIGFVSGCLHAVVQTEGEVALFGLYADESRPARGVHDAGIYAVESVRTCIRDFRSIFLSPAAGMTETSA